MKLFLQKAKAFYIILSHLWKNRVVIANPFRSARLFMERTPDGYEAELQYGGQTFIARKEDMNAVKEVLVDGAYDYMVPFLKELPHQPVVLDCGANIGTFSIRLLKERGDAKVVSVEAAAETYAILKSNAESSRGDWQAVHAAVWKSNGYLTLCRGESSERTSVQESTDGAGAIPARSLVAIKEEFGFSRVDLMKMDIEGAETVVIPATPDAIDADRMIIEFHKNHSDPTECCSVLVEKYPYALVAPEHLTDKSQPNIVYYLTKESVEIPGMVPVDLMAHLHEVYDPSDWR